MKACRRCSRTLSTDLFSKNKSKKSGLADWCKECMSNYCNQYGARPEIRAMARDRYKQKYASDSQYRQSIYLSVKAKIKKMGPEYQAAHWAIHSGLKSGAITKPTKCQRCPASGKLHAHHDDHSRPLEVMWLCPICHAARHKELGRLRTVARLYGDHPVVPDQTAPIKETSCK